MEVGRKTETWGSKFGFIMAAVGSSVGLGNFWRFPYTAGENGGGAFILIYLVCVAFVGLPLLMAEYSMGRKSGMSAIEGVQSLARAESKSLNWGIVGWVGTLTATFILSFYMVISAWLMAFTIQALGGSFEGMDAARSAANFNNTIGQGEHPLVSKWYMLLLLAIFLVANIFIVGRGVKGGIERAATVLMPAFFVMLVVVVGFGLANGDAARAASFLLTPKWNEVGFNTFLEAIGQAFFSIGIGVGLMITYGAYLSRETNIPQSAGIVAGSDTLVALVAGFAIFPVVFAAGRPQPLLHLDAGRLRCHSGRRHRGRCLLRARSLCRFHLFHLSYGSVGLVAGRASGRHPVRRRDRDGLHPFCRRRGLCLLAGISRLCGLPDRQYPAAAGRSSGGYLCRLDSLARDDDKRDRRRLDHECLALPDALAGANLPGFRPVLRLLRQDPAAIQCPAARLHDVPPGPEQ